MNVVVFNNVIWCTHSHSLGRSSGWWWVIIWWQTSRLEKSCFLPSNVCEQLLFQMHCPIVKDFDFQLFFSAIATDLLDAWSPKVHATNTESTAFCCSFFWWLFVMWCCKKLDMFWTMYALISVSSFDSCKSSSGCRWNVWLMYPLIRHHLACWHQVLSLDELC